MSQINLLDLVCEKVKNLKAYKVETVEEGIKLHANENPYSPSPELTKKILARFENLELNRYPDPDCKILKKAISSRIEVPENQLVVGNGSDELIQNLMQVFCNEGDTIAFPDPTFAMYAITAKGMGLKVETFPLNSKWDFEAKPLLKHLATCHARIVFISYPNNPTGNCFSRTEIQELIEKFEGIVVLDEAYYDFSGLTFLKQMKDHNNLVILRSLSKIGLAGLRVGYGIFPQILADEINKVRMPYNSNSISQIAASELLNNFSLVQNQIDSIKDERTRLLVELSKIESISAFPSDANFILFQTTENGEKVFKNLMENGILVRNLGTHPMLNNCLRVTIGTKAENDQFLERLTQAIQ
ncbi:MAG: histidinol-phosphate transaminase [Nitrospinae bacterium]|nr:histidinol-phosphate transaminase [Nitrospinota bacterium]